MSKFKLKIITPKGVYQEVEVNQLNLHQRYEFAVGNGFIYVNDNETKLIVDSIESKEEIDLNRAKEAKARAEERIHHPTEHTDLMRAEVALKKAINRIRVKELN